MTARRSVVAALAVLALGGLFARPAAATTRVHYIASDEVVWDYAPSGRDLALGGPLPPLGTHTLGRSYRKVVYREYTDATFKTLVPRPAAEAYMGLLGPTLHAEAGDTLAIVFKNNARVATGIDPMGLVASPRPAPVKPGAIVRYVWQVGERAAPGKADGSSIGWRYASPVDPKDDENMGLIGTIVVTRRGAARGDGSPADVDRELFTAFAEMDESQSRMLATNLADPSINRRHVLSKDVGAFYGSDNAWMSINGFVYGNMPMPIMRKGERVRWYLIVTRSDFDAHVPHWHGQTAVVNGMRTDAVSVAVDQVVVADMVPDNPGIWLYHCHVQGHLQLGMAARFEVLP